jgi:hypothetical protein
MFGVKSKILPFVFFIFQLFFLFFYILHSFRVRKHLTDVILISKYSPWKFQCEHTILNYYSSTFVVPWIFRTLCSTAVTSSYLFVLFLSCTLILHVFDTHQNLLFCEVHTNLDLTMQSPFTVFLTFPCIPMF